MCVLWSEKGSCEIADADTELLMFSTRQCGGEYSIKSYQICIRCVYFMRVATYLHAWVYMCRVYCTHVDIWHKPSFCKRLWLITSLHNWPFRCLQKKKEKKLLSPACSGWTYRWHCLLKLWSHCITLSSVAWSEKGTLCVYKCYLFLSHSWIAYNSYTSLHFKTVDFYEIMLLLYRIIWKL